MSPHSLNTTVTKCTIYPWLIKKQQIDVKTSLQQLNYDDYDATVKDSLVEGKRATRDFQGIPSVHERSSWTFSKSP